MSKQEFEHTTDHKKFEFTGETEEFFGVTLHRIRALRNFGTVRAGTLGGWIEREEQLSHFGNAWVHRNARVSGNASVSGNARVFGNAWVSGDAEVFGNAWVFGNARVSGDAEVSGNAWVFGNAWVSGNARVSGDAEVSGNARVSGDADLVCIGPIGSEKGTLVAHRDKELGLRVTRGCFSGSLDEFKSAVNKRHGNSSHGQTYMAAIAFIESFFAIRDDGADKKRSFNSDKV